VAVSLGGERQPNDCSCKEKGRKVVATGLESFQKLASEHMHEKKNKTSGNYGKENKSGRVNGLTKVCMK
jgi:hypothetical protein